MRTVRLWPLLAVVGTSQGCTRSCGTLDIFGTGVELVDPDRNARYAFDQAFGLQCGSGASEWATPPHTVAYFADGTITTTEPAWAFFFTPHANSRAEDWALATSLFPLLYTDGRVGTRLTAGDGLVSASLGLAQDVAVPRSMEAGDGGNFRSMNAFMGLTDGWVEVIDSRESGATCADVGEWMEVRLLLAFDLTFGPISELPNGHRPEDSGASMAGEAWFTLDRGKVGDPLWEDLSAWCALKETSG